METLHHRAASGGGSALRALRALQLAQKDLLNSDQNASAADSSGPTDYSRPFYWVSFVLMGNESGFLCKGCPSGSSVTSSNPNSKPEAYLPLLTIGTVVAGLAVVLLLSFALLPLLKPLRLLIVFAVHLLDLLLLAVLELILPMLIGVLAAHSLLFLIMPLLHPLAFGLLLLVHSVEVLLVFLLQRRIPGSAAGRLSAARTVGESTPAIVSPWTIRETAAVV